MLAHEAELARRLGVHERTIHNRLLRDGAFRLREMRIICKILDINNPATAARLFEWEEDKNDKGRS